MSSYGSSRPRPLMGWWIVVVVIGLGLLAWNLAYNANAEKHDQSPTVTFDVNGSINSDSGNGAAYPAGSYPGDYGTGGYENPAPGDDGTPDCAPGQGPIHVGSSDPYGLDGDGDGIGCE